MLINQINNKLLVYSLHTRNNKFFLFNDLYMYDVCMYVSFIFQILQIPVIPLAIKHDKDEQIIKLVHTFIEKEQIYTNVFWVSFAMHLSKKSNWSHNSLIRRQQVLY